ncbi:outer membrane protein assembly factor BamB family protein [Horticoccus sp. 23ND18S-11]|uniref:outer membrane protein assembly factor BamB family protein n=1 Tax=Horticoccus sp. 23ND18S-11 TaxID=3391832 RepID=UPI0039C9518F
MPLPPPPLSSRLRSLSRWGGASFLILQSLVSLGAAATPTQADWSTYLGSPQRNLYSPLQQITRANVGQLQVAWTYDTGEKGEYQANNLIVGGVLYTATPSRRVIALDAATGRERWQWDPASTPAGAGGRRQRGLVFWQNETGGEKRLFTAVGNHLFALDPDTGKLIASFGERGSIQLGSGLDVEGTPKVGLNTPGVVYQDTLIIGGIGGPGAVRGLDVRTGARRWIFHLIPRPGEVGHDTWPPEAYKTATGVMPWSGQALDEKRGIVYIATKTAEPDFYGADRHGDNLFANSLVALDANTGKRLWHFQIVHHDLLDKDLPCAPVLLTVTQGGKKIDAVAQGSKHGLLFVFDRVTGQPLWPIEEKPVPASELRGERAAATQPFPTKPAPLMRQRYTEQDVSPISPEALALTQDRIKLSPNFGPFPAPSLRETIMFPGFDGGMEWGGGAADPDGIYYVNVNEIPWILQMVETRRADGSPLPRGERDYLIHCAACHGLDRAGFPAAGFPSLLDVAQRRTPEEIVKLTQTGFGRMPAFDRLPDAQRAAILDYVLGRSAATGRPDEATSPTAKATARNTPPYAFGGFRRWTDQAGYPAIKPPWGTLNAVDLNTGEIKWKVPLGEYPELKARGLPPTGTENYGGPVVTAGGVIFIAASADETIRAFDKTNGSILWQAPLPFSGNATPSVYMVDGRQFVVISAGGGKSGRPAGGKIVAFALPASADSVR